MKKYNPSHYFSIMCSTFSWSHLPLIEQNECLDMFKSCFDIRVKPCHMNLQFNAPDINWPSHIDTMPFEPTYSCTFGIFPFDTHLCQKYNQTFSYYINISIKVDDNHLIEKSRNVRFKMFLLIFKKPLNCSSLSAICICLSVICSSDKICWWNRQLLFWRLL